MQEGGLSTCVGGENAAESLVDCDGAARECFGKPFENFPVPLSGSSSLPMNFFRRATCAFFLVVGAAQAQRIEDPDIDDYVPVVEDDLVVYTPKQAVRLGFRVLTGATVGFSGQGLIASSSSLGAETGIEARGYHDGFVGLDQRTVADPSGVFVPITPDGRTNTWGFLNASQATADGFIMMSAYEARVTDSSVHQKDPGAGFGMELALDRDVGNLFNTRLKWGFVLGMGVNQILSSTSADVAAEIKRTTDYYSLDGQAAPEVPYEAPEQVGGVDASVLLRADPLARVVVTTTSNSGVNNHWRLRGAFMTFRAGPTLQMPITQRFSASISTGAVLVYAGSTYEVTQTYKPETGEELGIFIGDTSSFFLPGYFIDANLQFAFTDNAGLYVGAVYQSSGDYEQEVSTPDGTSKYVSRVDLSSLQGIRAGLTFRF